MPDRASAHGMSNNITGALALLISHILKQKLCGIANSLELRNQIPYRAVGNVDITGVQFFIHTIDRSRIASRSSQRAIGENSLGIDEVHQHLFDGPFPFRVTIGLLLRRYCLKELNSFDFILFQHVHVITIWNQIEILLIIWMILIRVRPCMLAILDNRKANLLILGETSRR